MTADRDVIIMGGGPAGLSAALILGLARRRVLVVDEGKPRNAVAHVSHGLLTRDGVPPGEIVAAAREQLNAYPTVEFLADTITDATIGSPITVTMKSGKTQTCRKLVLACGVADQLPSIPGLAECWGKTIWPCPYCHAWEFRDKPIAHLGNTPGVAGTLATLRSWSKDIALMTNGPPRLEYAERMAIHNAKVPLYDQPVAAFEHESGKLLRVQFQDGKVLTRAAVHFIPPTAPRSDLPRRLGLIENGVFRINPQTSQTSNPNIFVAGDLIGLFTPLILSSAIYSGTFTGRHVNHDLAVEDFRGL